MVGTYARHRSLAHAIGARRRAEAPDLTLWEGKTLGLMCGAGHRTVAGQKKWDACHLPVAFRLTEGERPLDQQYTWKRIDEE